MHLNTQVSIITFTTMVAFSPNHLNAADFRFGAGVGYAHYASKSGFDLNVVTGSNLDVGGVVNQKELASKTKHTADLRVFVGVEHFIDDMYFGGEFGYRFMPGSKKTVTKMNAVNTNAGLDEPFTVESSLKHTIYADAHLGSRVAEATTVYGIVGARVAFHKAELNTDDTDIESGVRVTDTIFGGAVGLGVSHKFSDGMMGSLEGTYEMYQSPSQSRDLLTDASDLSLIKTTVERPRVLSVMFKVSKKI